MECKPQGLSCFTLQKLMVACIWEMNTEIFRGKEASCLQLTPKQLCVCVCVCVCEREREREREREGRREREREKE